MRSLIDGIAGQAALQVGNLVSTTSVLTSVSQVNPIKVYFYISEQEYLTLSAQAKGQGKSDLLNSGNAIPLQLTLANGPGLSRDRPHHLRRPLGERADRQHPARGRLCRTPATCCVRASSASITADTGVLQNAVLVPQRAVAELQGMNQVYVVGATAPSTSAPSSLARRSARRSSSPSGLSAGETVVTEGLDKLKDGMKVSTQPDTATSAPASSARELA